MAQHINHIEISNFKSIHHQKIDGCKRINVFVGPPNVGKSNILEALTLLSPVSSKNGEIFSLGHVLRIKNSSELYQLYFNQEYKNDIIIEVNNLIQLRVVLERTNGSLKIDINKFTTDAKVLANLGQYT